MSNLEWDLYLAAAVFAWWLIRLAAAVVRGKVAAGFASAGLTVWLVIPLWNAWTAKNGPSNFWCGTLLLVGAALLVLALLGMELRRRREYRQLML